jgi:subtilisin family serine protease
MEADFFKARVFEAAPRLGDGRSLFDRDSDPAGLGLDAYRATPPQLRALAAALEARGLVPVAGNAFTLSVLAPDGWRTRDDWRIDAETGLATLPGEAQLAGLAATPPILLHVDPLPPTVPYFCLRAPVDLLTVLNGTRASLSGHDGDGVRISIVDSGCDTSHPFFAERGVRIALELGPGMHGPDVDTLGHGTMICGTIVSIAPAARLTMIKTDEDLSLSAFKAAVRQDPPPQIIQNTWGAISDGASMTPCEKAVHAAVTDAVAAGIVVVFAAGNQKIIFPPQVPAALAAGGAFVDQDGLIRASDYASGYGSSVFPGRTVPDVCGLVGPAPSGVYMMLPTAPGSIIDRSFAALPYPRGDGGSGDDGWVVISGTSSASAQVAGLTALLLQARPELHPDAVKRILAATARRIQAGASAQGGRSGPSYPNPATGWGLIDIGAALAYARAMA